MIKGLAAVGTGKRAEGSQFPPASEEFPLGTGFGERLRRAREAAGFKSPRALSVEVGLSDGQVMSYEKGSQEPKLSVLLRIAQALRVGVDWLARGEGPMEYLPVGHVTAEGERIVQPLVMPLPAPRYPTRADLEALEGQPEPPEPVKTPPLFGSVDIKRLAEAIKISEDEFAIRGMHPSPRRKAQIFLQIYDAFSSASPEKMREILRIWHMEDLSEGDDL